MLIYQKLQKLGCYKNAYVQTQRFSKTDIISEKIALKKLFTFQDVIPYTLSVLLSTILRNMKTHERFALDKVKGDDKICLALRQYEVIEIDMTYEMIL